MKLSIPCGFWPHLPFLTPSRAWVIQHLNIWIATDEWLKHVYFPRHSSGGGSLRFCWCAVPRPAGCSLLGSPSPCRWGWSMRQWSETPGRTTHLHAHKGREGARAKRILVWAQITSRFTSWKKSKCLLSWHYLQCSEFSDIHPEAEDHHATRNSSMNYVQNLQGSLHNILHSINNFTSVLTVCWSCCFSVLLVPVTADWTNVNKCLPVSLP